MSLSRWAVYANKMSLFRMFASWLLWTSFVVFATSSLAQADAISAGVTVAKGFANANLTEASLVLSGICVAALVYGLKIAYQMHQEQVKGSIETTAAIVKLTDSLSRLSEELRSRPCFVDANRVR